MELEHFSHDHPLILMTNTGLQVDDDEDHGGGKVIICSACMQPISDKYYYGCSPCLFILHKSCAELPREITYPSHPDHPLNLLPNPPRMLNRCCDVCGEACSRFTYHCSTCDYDVDIKCASMASCIQHKVEHTSHPEHQLIPLQKSAMFMCDACGSKHEGTSYLCTTCGFWANQKCVSSPTTIQLSHHHHHHHPLTLIRSIPPKY